MHLNCEVAMANEPFNNLSKPSKRKGRYRMYRKFKDIPPEKMAEYIETVKRMPDGNEKAILTWYFQYISPREIPELCKANGIMSRTHTFYSARSVENIVKKHFPDIMDYRGNNPQTEIRREHHKFARTHEKKKCANCGRVVFLEWHHKKPLEFGGETNEENMEVLCKFCHAEKHEGLREGIKIGIAYAQKSQETTV